MDCSSNTWSLSLDLNGGRIKELTYKEERVLGTYARIDGKQGNTHLCIPSFDKEGQEKYNLPFHGLVRNVQWNVELKTQNKIHVSTTTQTTDSYPASLKVEQRFSLGSEFIHETSVHHISGEPVPVNIGVHYYWDTPLGWEKTTVNGLQSAEYIKDNGYIELQENNIIQFPHATYELTSKGFHNAVLWTNGSDFCCIEPVLGWPGYFGREVSMLEPGKSISASIKVRKVV